MTELAAGTRLGPYEVVSLAGSGAMGEVYRARDTRLDRTVALKVVGPAATGDPEARARFEREARAASSLSHPNICTLYDVGRQAEVEYLVMEFLEGQTLTARIAAGPLPFGEALGYAVNLAEALACAHAHDIVHRDLKPGNVIVTATGAKLLDFGLVKRVESASLLSAGAAATSHLSVTSPGLIVGTLSYMSPEQARGEPVDARTDVFSLGVVLYEMVTGVKPFAGATAADVVAAILGTEPPPASSRRSELPGDVDAVVGRALAKRREARYSTADALRADLVALRREHEFRHRLSAGAAGGVEATSPSSRAAGPEARTGTASRPRAAASSSGVRRRRSRRTIASLAVLPLVNASPDPAAEYLSDGLTESIINGLSQVPRLRVMARSTVFRYKGRDVEPQAVGSELDVRGVLVGRVAQLGERLIVSVELVDVDDGSQVWGGQYQRPADDILALQEEIASEISGKLRLRLTGDEKRRIARRHTRDSDAYRYYLQGRFHVSKRGYEPLLQALECFNQAVRVDPLYALAYAGLADCYALMIGAGTVDTDARDLVAKARAAARRALELDESLVEGHASMAFIAFRLEWDWPSAEERFARAIELQPAHAGTRHWYGMYLAARGRFDEALAQMSKAAEIDPLSLNVMAGVGKIHYFMGRFREAIELDRRILKLDPTFFSAGYDLAFALLASGAHAEARALLEQSPMFAPRRRPHRDSVLPSWVFAIAGEAEAARATLPDLHEDYRRGLAASLELAFTYAGLGEFDEALVWLRLACDQRSGPLTYAWVDPVLREAIGDPRVVALLEAVGITRPVGGAAPGR